MKLQMSAHMYSPRIQFSLPFVGKFSLAFWIGSCLVSKFLAGLCFGFAFERERGSQRSHWKLKFCPNASVQAQLILFFTNVLSMKLHTPTHIQQELGLVYLDYDGKYSLASGLDLVWFFSFCGGSEYRPYNMILLLRILHSLVQRLVVKMITQHKST